MKSIAVAFGALFLVSWLASCGPELPVVTAANASSPRQTYLTFRSEAIAQGSTGIKEGQLEILLPASYESTPDRRYPVVYTLHGYGSRPEEMIVGVAPVAESLGAPEMIMVGIWGSGSFYTDSPKAGRWATMVTKEVVPLIDARYRTVATAAGRMVAGFSMGGFGAWNLALAHPEVFSSAWAVCPGAFDAQGLQDALLTWDPGFYSDYAAAFAPQTGTGSPPAFDGSPSDKALIADLENGFGNVEAKIKAYLAKNTPLKALRFDYGTLDSYEWIPRGTESVAAALAAAGLNVSVEGRMAGHQISDAMVENGFVPLVRQVFGAL